MITAGSGVVIEDREIEMDTLEEEGIGEEFGLRVGGNNGGEREARDMESIHLEEGR